MKKGKKEDKLAKAVREETRVALRKVSDLFKGGDPCSDSSLLLLCRQLLHFKYDEWRKHEQSIKEAIGEAVMHSTFYQKPEETVDEFFEALYGPYCGKGELRMNDIRLKLFLADWINGIEAAERKAE